MDISVLYQDDHIVVCVKPRGVFSQLDSRGRRSMPELLADLCVACIYPVHRLDTEVSGVMVYAKTREAAAELCRQISDHERFVKYYLAVVEGKPEAPQATLEDLLFHDKNKNKSYVVDRLRGGVKAAKLEYETVAKATGLTLVRVRLYTGRTHQIRVQFAARGTPLAGDKKYGAATGGAVALFSQRLCFDHPTLKTPLCFEVPEPKNGVWEKFTER